MVKSSFNSDSFKKRLNRIRFRLRGRVSGLLNEATDLAAERIAQSLKEQSVGKTYKRGNVTHIASAPGDAPNTDQGNLAKSIDQIDSTPATLTSSLFVGGVQAPYASILEFGTNRVAERPFFFPAISLAKALFLEKLDIIK